MSKIMLLQLPILNYLQKDYVDSDDGYNPSLGLLALGTYLELNGHESIVIDMCYQRLVVSQLLERIRTEAPILIGISVYTENFIHGKTLSKIIKEKFPHIKIAMGGAHATLQPMESIECEFVDFVIMNEGEATLLELVEAVSSHERSIKYEQIPGLYFKRDNEIAKNPPRKKIQDLDELPILKRELADISRYSGYVNISTSRGCPGKCIYCAATALSGASYRTRSEYSIYLEMVMLKKLIGDKLTKIYIVDDTFTAIPKRIDKFIDLIEKHELGLYWQCESRIDVMTEELLKRMKKAGCLAIQYGIESGSQEVLDKIKKKIDLEYAKKIIQCTYDNQIIPCLSFMIGHFCDTKATMWETAHFLEEMYNKYRAELALSFNTPFPGTWQYTHREHLGMKITTPLYTRYTLVEPIVETDNFTIDDQREIFCYCSRYMGHHERITRFAQQIKEI